MSDENDFDHIDLQDAWSRPPEEPDWVLPGLAIGTVGNIVSPGGLGKSFLMLATALSVAIGRDVGSIWGEAHKQGKCAFLSLEDPDVVLRGRLHALGETLTEEEKDAALGHLRVFPAAGKGLTFASQIVGRGEPQVTPRFLDFKKFLREDLKPRLLIVDTLNRALGGLSENDAGTMGWMLSQLEELAREAECAIVLCHHVSKASTTNGTGGSSQAARGSSVITDNARWQVNLFAPSDPGVETSPSKRKGDVRLQMTKSNYKAPIAGRWLKRSHSGVLVHPDDQLARGEPTVVSMGKLKDARRVP